MADSLDEEEGAEWEVEEDLAEQLRGVDDGLEGGGGGGGHDFTALYVERWL